VPWIGRALRRPNAARRGRHGVARHGGARQGMAGGARRGAAGRGMAGHGRLGVARHGLARRDKARRGAARRGMAGMEVQMKLAPIIRNMSGDAFVLAVGAIFGLRGQALAQIAGTGAGFRYWDRDQK